MTTTPALIILNAVGIAILALLHLSRSENCSAPFAPERPWLATDPAIYCDLRRPDPGATGDGLLLFSSVSEPGIDSWFDVRIEKALDDALLLERSTLEAAKLEVIRQARIAGRRIGYTPLPSSSTACSTESGRPADSTR